MRREDMTSGWRLVWKNRRETKKETKQKKKKMRGFTAHVRTSSVVSCLSNIKPHIREESEKGDDGQGRYRGFP